MTELVAGFGSALFRIFANDRGGGRMILELSGRPSMWRNIELPEVEGLLYPGTVAQFSESFESREYRVHLTRQRDREIPEFTVSRRISESAVAYGRGAIQVDMTQEMESLYRNVTAALTIAATNERMTDSLVGLGEGMARLSEVGRLSGEAMNAWVGTWGDATITPEVRNRQRDRNRQQTIVGTHMDRLIVDDPMDVAYRVPMNYSAEEARVIGTAITGGRAGDVIQVALGVTTAPAQSEEPKTAELRVRRRSIVLGDE